jgi:AraC-like DNA-binding protein
MDWIEGLNQAIAYIDKNLDSEIDYGEISRLTFSPIGVFQRFFVMAAGITLAEYIRRRKLTNALIDLQKTDAKVIDVAYKYGYESSDAFCVAFKRLYGMTPSQARKTTQNLKHYDRIFFTLTITYVKGESDMILLNVDKYRYVEPLFEGVRIILNNMGEKYTPEYIQGISGAAFKISGGCPSRPTCVLDRWTPDFIRYLGYEVTEYPCFDEDGSETMIEAVKKQIDNGKPALVWHAFTNAEYDVVCGYDNEAKQFIGRGSHKGFDDYARESWDRAKTCDMCPAFGAILIGDKISELDSEKAEIDSIVNAVKHARDEKDPEKTAAWEVDGVKFYYQWADEYAREGKERGLADAYCHDVYSSVRRAAAAYLREIAGKYTKYEGGVTDCFQYAAASFEREADELDKARPYLSWESPWGIDEERSKNVAPILKAAAEHYEKGVEYLEKILQLLDVMPQDDTNIGFSGSAEDFKSTANEFSAKKFTGEIRIDFVKNRDTASSVKVNSECSKGDLSLSIQLAGHVESIAVGEYTINLDNYDDGKYTITAIAKSAEDISIKYEFV